MLLIHKLPGKADTNSTLSYQVETDAEIEVIKLSFYFGDKIWPKTCSSYYVICRYIHSPSTSAFLRASSVSYSLSFHFGFLSRFLCFIFTLLPLLASLLVLFQFNIRSPPPFFLTHSRLICHKTLTILLPYHQLFEFKR